MRYDTIIVGGTAGCIPGGPPVRGPTPQRAPPGSRTDFPDPAQLPDMLKYGWGAINLEARQAGGPTTGPWKDGECAPAHAHARAPWQGHRDQRSMARRLFVAPRRILPPGPPGATRSGPTNGCCPISRNWRTMRISAMRFTARTAPSRCAAFPERPGRPCKRPFIAPVSRPTFPSTLTCTTRGHGHQFAGGEQRGRHPHEHCPDLSPALPSPPQPHHPGACVGAAYPVQRHDGHRR